MAEPKYEVKEVDYDMNQISVEFSDLFTIDEAVRTRFEAYPDELAEIEHVCVIIKTIAIQTDADGLPDKTATAQILEQQLRGCVVKARMRRDDLIAKLDRKLRDVPGDMDLAGMTGGLTVDTEQTKTPATGVTGIKFIYAK